MCFNHAIRWRENKENRSESRWLKARNRILLHALRRAFYLMKFCETLPSPIWKSKTECKKVRYNLCRTFTTNQEETQDISLLAAIKCT